MMHDLVLVNPNHAQYIARMAELLHRLGGTVRTLRAAHGWTRAELARRAGVSARFLVELEGGTGNISVLRLAEVARALDVSLATLVAGLGPVHDAADELAALEPERRRALLRRERAGRKVALVGLRGAGKSTVGARLGRRLGVPFVEVDQVVEELAGLRLGEIFEFHGPARYRELERAALDRELSRPGGGVLATGGSVVTAPDTWAMLKGETRTVWLRASPESHLSRVEAQGDFRPMRGRANALAELEAILAVRTPLYAESALEVDTERLDADGVVDRIVNWLGAEAR